MELKNTYELVKKYRDYVVQQSRSNLTRMKHNNTKSLYNSIKGEILIENNFAVVGFRMNDYGQYLDQGVKGKTSGNKAPNSIFQFKNGGSGGLTKGIQKWVRQRGIQFKDKKTGKFLSYDSTAYLITRSIWHKGLESTLFFTKPFNAGYKKYVENEMINTFAADIDTLVDYNLTKTP